MEFSRLRQQTTPEAAVVAIREAILSGDLPQGSQLREVHIANEMGISRAPLREALRKLEEEGLVVKIPFRGSFVATVSEDTIAEIISLRTRLEPYAVERSLPKLLGSEAWRLEEASDALEATVRAGDIAASLENHLALHRLFYELADHRLLLRLWQEWEAQLRLFLGADHAAFGHLDRIQADHQRLNAVLKTGDLAAITVELVVHISAGPLYVHEGDEVHLIVGTPQKASHTASAADGEPQVMVSRIRPSL
jgi:DNA-binding GntR family transcriptional regulator